MMRGDTANSLRGPARLRVLQCITHLGLGGAEQVAHTLIRGMRDEIDFAVFAVHGAKRDAVGLAMRQELEIASTPWFAGTTVPLKLGGMVPGAIALARTLRAFRPDIVHLHTEIPEACAATLVQLRPRQARVPMVRTIHNSIYWRYWPRLGAWCDRRLARAAIACVSEAAREEFLRYRTQSGANPVSPSVIPNGVAIDPRPPRRQPGRPGIRRVLFAGRFEFQKGTDILCQALPLVALEQGVRGELVLIGEGAHQSQLHALAHAAPPNWKIEVRAPIANLPQLLPDFDLVVMPSRFEGLPLVAVEAILCGVPVAATDAPGLREALPPEYPWRARREDAGDFARCLSRALAEVPRWPDVIADAQQYVSVRFDPRVMADRYRQLYRQVADAGSAKS